MSADHDTSQPARQRESIQWCPRCERGAGDAEQCPACEGATVPGRVATRCRQCLDVRLGEGER